MSSSDPDLEPAAPELPPVGEVDGPVGDGSRVAAVLRRLLTERQAGNPRYSLRRFAADIGLSPSRLSEVLSGRGRLAYATALDLGPALGLAAFEGQRWRMLVDAELAPDPLLRESAEAWLLASARHAAARQLTVREVEAFDQLLPAVVFEALSLAECPPRSDAQELWLTRVLRRGPAEIFGALMRLKRLGLIGVEQGRYVRLRDFYATPDGIPSATLRRIHADLMRRALVALDRLPVTDRLNHSLVIPMRSRDLPVAAGMVAAFLKEFHERFSRGQAADGDGAYCLGLQLHPLTESAGAPIVESPV